MMDVYEDCSFTLLPTESTVGGKVFSGVGFSGSDNVRISHMIQCSLDGTIWGDWWGGLKQQFIDANNLENIDTPIFGTTDCSEWKILNKIAYVSDVYDEERKFNVSIEDWEKFIIALTFVKEKKCECQLTIRFID